ARAAHFDHGGAQAIAAVPISGRYSERSSNGEAERGTGCAGFAGATEGPRSPVREPAALSGDVRAGDVRAFAGLFANRVMGRAISASSFRTAAIERFGHRDLSEVSAEVPVQPCV